MIAMRPTNADDFAHAASLSGSPLSIWQMRPQVYALLQLPKCDKRLGWCPPRTTFHIRQTGTPRNIAPSATLSIGLRRTNRWVCRTDTSDSVKLDDGEPMT